MINEEQYHQICKNVLKRHYYSFREDINDGFFYNTPTQAEKRLLKMIRDFRSEMEQRVPVSHNDSNSQVLKEQILGDYINIARKYGNKVKRKQGM
ncbi:hypothetical protein M3P19_00900 [Muricauda sp. 2012CJ35-5]|uniref:Uncharacterized protein n=1 Tax=Flagellimonas spongiicola TaxID=2942208 RepID=A0ABT0PMI1_9FLAO|nr:hypothetical protein [Allomuricauda spongiicola]MCL6272543.1 hypothetical protein [Allomuricauda spongiicola]